MSSAMTVSRGSRIRRQCTVVARQAFLERKPCCNAVPGRHPVRSRHISSRARIPLGLCATRGNKGSTADVAPKNSPEADISLDTQHLSDDGSSSDADGDGGAMQSVTRNQVYSACLTTSAAMILVCWPVREAARVFSAPLLGTDQAAIDELLNISFSVEHLGLALSAAAAVTLMRITLLKSWPDFADATERSNTQVLTPLGLADIPVVACIPGIAEEALFRGTLVPATFPDWRGVLFSGLIFGILHNNGGRNLAFSAWASAVGVMYGMLFLYTKDISAAMIAHSVANLGSALIWTASRDTTKLPGSSSDDSVDL